MLLINSTAQAAETAEEAAQRQAEKQRRQEEEARRMAEQESALAYVVPVDFDDDDANLSVPYGVSPMWERFTVRDGLPDLKIECLFIDRTERLWLGLHHGGLVHFDGHRFIAHDVGAGGVFAITEDAAGLLYLATDQGLIQYDRAHPRRLYSDGRLLWGAVATADDCLWFGAERQPGKGATLLRWDGRRAEAMEITDPTPAGQSLHCLAVDEAGQLWCGGDGLYRQEGDAFECITPTDGTLGQVFDLDWRDGVLWLAADTGLWTWVDGQFKWPFTEKATMSTHVDMAVDQTGRRWSTTQDGRLFYCTKGRTELAFKGAVGFHKGLCVDSQNILWAGTYEGGLYRFDLDVWRNVQVEPGHKPVRLLAEGTDGVLYAAGRDGVEVYRDGIEVCPPIKPSHGAQVSGLAVDPTGNVWFGLRDGRIFAQIEGTVREFTRAAPLRGASVIFAIGSDGAFWFASKLGLGVGCYRLGQTHIYAPGQSPQWVGAMAVDDDGYLWLGSNQPSEWEGLARFDGAQFEPIKGLANCSVLSLCPGAQGRLWIGTSDGLYVRTRRGIERVAGRSAQLPCPIITALYWDGGKLWVGTEGGGAYLYDGRTLHALPLSADPDVRLVRAIHQDQSGQTWFATEAGLVRYTLPMSLGTLVLDETPPPWGDRLDLKDRLIGRSDALYAVWEEIAQAARHELPVVILGETGVGKSEVARLIHELSPRSEAPFRAVNCGAIPKGVIESELFGHERGAFTGAVNRRIGAFESADQGTIFLDEIGDLPLEQQVHFLHVLQDKRIYRLGAEQDRALDIRVVTATHRDLKQEIDAGRFRADLYYRLAAAVFVIPPLRDRKDDIALLAAHFAGQTAAHYRKPSPHLSSAALHRLHDYDWPGNVRELEQCIEVATVLAMSRGVIEVDHLKLDRHIPGGDAVGGHIAPLESVEREHIIRTLTRCRGKVDGAGGAAEALHMNRSTLVSRLKKLGIRARDYAGTK